MSLWTRNLSFFHSPLKIHSFTKFDFSFCFNTFYRLHELVWCSDSCLIAYIWMNVGLPTNILTYIERCCTSCFTFVFIDVIFLNQCNTFYSQFFVVHKQSLLKSEPLDIMKKLTFDSLSIQHKRFVVFSFFSLAHCLQIIENSFFISWIWKKKLLSYLWLRYDSTSNRLFSIHFLNLRSLWRLLRLARQAINLVRLRDLSECQRISDAVMIVSILAFASFMDNVFAHS